MEAVLAFGRGRCKLFKFSNGEYVGGKQDRILEFSQELVKICAAANIFDFPVYFGAVFSLGVYMTERQHIYEDLNESSSASPGGSQQLEILPSPNSKRAANFFQIR